MLASAMVISTDWNTERKGKRQPLLPTSDVEPGGDFPAVQTRSKRVSSYTVNGMG